MLHKSSDYRILGSDSDPKCISLSMANARKAGVADCITFKDGDATKMPLPADSGILICNPPYGQRMMEQQSAQRLYAAPKTVMAALGKPTVPVTTSLSVPSPPQA